MSIKTDKFASYKLLAIALEKQGYSISTWENEDNKTMVSFESPRGAEWVTRGGGITYPFNNERVIRYSVNKDLAHQFVKKEGIPSPFTTVIQPGEKSEELPALLERRLPLVVKPTDSSLSKGVTLGIKDTAQLKKAIVAANKFSNKVLVQEQVTGEEIRLVVLSGKLACALLRQTARVKGDGVSTVAQLIKKENKIRDNLVFKYLAYPRLDEKIIDAAHLKSAVILQEGEVKELNESTMIKGGCSVYDVTKQIASGYIKIAEKLAKKLGAGFLAVDMICRDYSNEPAENDYYFLEFNTSPVLKLFYSCRDGKQVDIIPQLTSYIDAWIHKK